MKALFIGDTSSSSTSRFYADALEVDGHSVTRVAPNFFKAQSIFDRLWIGFSKTPPQHRLTAFERDLSPLLKENRFDFVLVFAENFLPETVLEQLKKSGAKLLYHSHDNNFADGILKPSNFTERLKFYDIVFTTKSQNVSRYGNLGISQAHYLPSAYSPVVHRPIPLADHRPLFPVSFVGTYDHSREPLLQAVGWEYLHIWGNGWKKFKNFKTFQEHITPKAIYNDDFSDVMSRSQLSLGLLREEAGDLHTQRTFEIPACGTLQIAPRNDEILGFFEEDKEIICFSSSDELREKTHYYLTHDSERIRIAQHGFERVTRGKHSYRDRVDEMLKLL